MPKSYSSGKSNPLQAYLSSNRTADKFSHTSIGPPMGKYFIKPACMEEFFSIYHQVTFETDAQGERVHPIYLTEGIKDKEYTPVKIDIDFRYFKDQNKRVYTNEDIDRVCMLYMRKIEEYIETPDEDERLFYILEKPGAIYDRDKKGKKKTNDDGLYKIKDGVHIMAPDIVTNDYLQLLLREYVYKNCDDIFDRHHFDNSYADIFDRAVIDRNNWQMYGSTKPGKPPYYVTRVIRVYKDRVEELDTIPDSQTLVRLLSVRNKPDASMIKLDKEEEVNNPENTTTSRRLITKKKQKAYVTKLTKTELKIVPKYVSCLSAKRATDFNTWIEVGWCLHNMHNKTNALLKEWISFSKKSPDHSDTCSEECEELWDNMNDEGLGMASLKMWAYKDSEQELNLQIQSATEAGATLLIKKLIKDGSEYTQLRQQDIYSNVLKACNNGKGTSYDVANVLHIMYKDYHVCVSLKNCTWYYYDMILNRWVLDDKGITLKSKISVELYKTFAKIRGDENDKIQDEEDDPQHSSAATHAANIGKVMLRLKETSFKSNLMTECSELFYDKDKKFVDKLDSHKHLIGFNNGIYNLKTDEFRKGRPEDYISKSTNINYFDTAAYKASDGHARECACQGCKDKMILEDFEERKAQIHDFYKKVFVIKKVREYVLIRSSSFLSGSTRDESFDIYSGKGGNGKSKHMELMEEIFGDYAVKLPISLITAKRAASNAATPELARTKGARLCSMQEPDTKTKINVGLMKELTGGDKIQARALYGEPIEFKPQFKIVLCCNDKPELPQKDEGTWRRVRNTEFPSKFTYDIEGEKALDFKINQDLSDKFENWAEPFMIILLDYYKKYKTENLLVPDEIIGYTSEYRASSNHFRDFINDRVDIDITKQSMLTLDKINLIYRDWYRGVNADGKPKNRKELQSYLDDTYGKYHSPGVQSKDRGYKGLKIKVKNNSGLCEINDDLDELDQ